MFYRSVSANENFYVNVKGIICVVLELNLCRCHVNTAYGRSKFRILEICPYVEALFYFVTCIFKSSSRSLL